MWDAARKVEGGGGICAKKRRMRGKSSSGRASSVNLTPGVSCHDGRSSEENTVRPTMQRRRSPRRRRSPGRPLGGAPPHEPCPRPRGRPGRGSPRSCRGDGEVGEAMICRAVGARLGQTLSYCAVFDGHTGRERSGWIHNAAAVGVLTRAPAPARLLAVDDIDTFVPDDETSVWCARALVGSSGPR